jgi:hypothetical protein
MKIFGEVGYIDFWVTTRAKSVQWLIDSGLVSVVMEVSGKPIPPLSPEDYKNVYHLRIGRRMWKLKNGKLTGGKF